MTRKKTQFTRRDFIKIMGATTISAIPILVGYELLRSGEGEYPIDNFPYAIDDQLIHTLPISEEKYPPILLLLNDLASNPFGQYLGEVMRAEGLNSFSYLQLSDMKDYSLDRFDLILLTEGPLDQSQADLLNDFVFKGGRLVAMRPDKRLANLFGLEWISSSISEGYIRINGSHRIGKGIVQDLLQFHGDADLYRLDGAETIAWLFEDEHSHAKYPAVTINKYGHGLAAMWAFDLAKSVAYTRQGNPAWSNQERDGLEGIRACDMFKDWVNLDRIPIPQADEQQRLLTNLFVEMSQEKRVLPRLWYFPGDANGVLIATGDSHGNPAPSVEEVISRVEKYGGHISIYYTPPTNSTFKRAARRAWFAISDLPIVGTYLKNYFKSPTPSQIADWRTRGHEFALHPYVEEGLVEGWQQYWMEFTGLGYAPVPPTVRTHRVLWSGWVETAHIQAAYGIRMNLDYYHVGPAFQKSSGEWEYGYFTGSGLPMKFIDEQGRVLNIYQQLTHLIDEQLIKMPWGDEWEKLDLEAALNVSRTIIDRSLNGSYGAIATQFHTDPFFTGGEYAKEAGRWLEGTLMHAANRGIPIISASEWLNFVDIRHDARFNDILWYPESKHLRFKLDSKSTSGVELTVMLPETHGKAQLSKIKVDGNDIKHQVRNLGGINYSWVSVESGSHSFDADYSS